QKNINEYGEFLAVKCFLDLLQFCATIKRNYKDYKQILDKYCKKDLLPKAREVLNSAGIEYKFGNFKIKINKKEKFYKKIFPIFYRKEKENLEKIENWLIEEEDFNEKEKEEKVDKNEEEKVVKKEKVIVEKNKLDTINEENDKEILEED
uniref:Uncharacterized protein n=1 Tax=Meloidogyne hapla TaxID=6305 RepID=A0A1I8BPR0_MELHA